MHKPGQALVLRGMGVMWLEILAAVAVSTGLVAALDTVAPITGLGVIYLLAVLFVAIRHGEVAALATAVLGVSALNFFFIDPRYQLTVDDRANIVALGVLLVAAVVIGRLATAARQQAAEAEQRARVAAAREHEARMLAAAASSLVDGGGLDTQLHSIQSATADGPRHVRVDLSHAPSPEPDELAVRLPTSGRSGWLYLSKELSWTKEDQQRIAEALARLIDVAVERERLNAQAAEAEATRRAEVAKTAVLHAISHDLRSPLTGITTAASGLRDEGISSEDRAELVSVITDEATRLSHLVDDLLDLSRIEAGAVDPQPDWCDLRDVAVGAAAQVRARHGDHPIEFALPSNLPLVRTDPVQLERVFTNLIENAVKFSPPDVPVRVTGNASGGRVTVRVLDKGSGVPRSQRARIFEPFVRGKELGHGSGLGLAICKGFVEANGGRILLQAGAGETAFAVTFPLSGQPALR
jgi:two-component system, OmpR family, sensor histidine kinase KdpD